MESQQDRVLMQLRDLILRGEFAPGERLAEIPLSERLKASRTPVRLALATLEREGLVEASPQGGYVMRRYTPREISDAIAVRGLLEGMAARLVAEHGVTRQLSLDLHECLEQIDRVLRKPELGYDDYAHYTQANTRLHSLVVTASGNSALQRALALNDHLPFASASALLPMQSSVEEGLQLLQYAHRQHHALVDAMERGQGARAQALAEEHVQIALTNLDHALKRPVETTRLLPGMRLVAGLGV